MAGEGFALSKQVLTMNRDLMKEQQIRDAYRQKKLEYQETQDAKNKFKAHPFANKVSQRYRDVLQSAINDSQNWYKDNYAEIKAGQNPDLSTEWENRKTAITTLTSDITQSEADLKGLEDYMESGDVTPQQWEKNFKRGASGNFTWQDEATADLSNDKLVYENGQYLIQRGGIEGLDMVKTPISETFGYDYGENVIFKEQPKLDVNGGLATIVYKGMQVGESGDDYSPESYAKAKEKARQQLILNSTGTAKSEEAGIKRDELIEEYIAQGNNQDVSAWDEEELNNFLDFGADRIIEDTQAYLPKPVADTSRADKAKGLVIDKAFKLEDENIFQEQVVGLDYTGETFQGGRPQYTGGKTIITEKAPFKKANTFSYNNQKWETIEIVKDDKGEWFVNAYNEGSAFDDTGTKTDYQQETLVPLSDPTVQTQLGINMVDGNPVGYEAPEGVDYSNITETTPPIDDYSQY
tara:strand:+ start:11311 stop:12705 length:1395 start_codon:yes stop_codon:yes gene_type:complete